MISAFARAAQAFDDQRYSDRAKQAADFCLTELRQADGRLLKRWRLGKAGLPAHLEDYAFFAQGLLDLYETVHDPEYLKQAKKLIDMTRDLFEDRESGGFFLTARDGEKLLTRPKEIYDGAIPSGNSIMALNLARIWKMTGDEQYKQCLNLCFSAFSGFLTTNPSGAENFLHALAFILHPPHEILIHGDRENVLTHSILKEVKEHFLPFKTLLHLSNSGQNPDLLKMAPYLSAYSSVQKPTFFSLPGFSMRTTKNRPF